MDAIGHDVECDGHLVKFIDPCGLAVFGCIADRFRETETPMRLINFSEKELAYISRMDTFAGLVNHQAELGARHDRHDALVEVTRLESGQNSEATARRLVDCLLGGMSDLPEDETPDEMTCMNRRNSVEEPLAYMFSELLDNVFQHGRRFSFPSHAWVCAQYYPSNDLVRFAIVDNGCGLLKSLEGHPDLAEQTDKAAIRLALRERVSCNPALILKGSDHSANQGVGLTVVSRIIEMAHGRMWVASGSAAWEVGTAAPKYAPPWQGCIVAAEVKRKALMNVRVHKVIESLHAPKTIVNLDFF
jgi:hypothetical protein